VLKPSVSSSRCRKPAIVTVCCTCKGAQHQEQSVVSVWST
jgi:hypothetical protein